MKRVFYLISLLLGFFLLVNFSCDGGNHTQNATDSQKTISNTQTTQQQTAAPVQNQNQNQNQTTANQPNPAQQLYTFNDLNFAIWFPAQPKVTHDTFVDAGYNIQAYTIVLGGDSSTYMVQVAFYPEDALQGVSEHELLKNVMSGFTGSINAEPTSFKFNKVQGRNGLIYALQANGVYFVVQNLINGNTVYQILIGKLGQKPTDDEINQFIGSFRFLR